MKIPALLSILVMGVAILTTPASAANKYNKDYFGETIVHKAAFEDTLIHLARHNGLGFVEVRAANPTLDSWIPGKGAKVILPKQHILPDAPRDGLVVNLAEMRVYYFKEQGQPPQTYPISIGREGLQTPVGTTTIVRKKDGPTWRPTKRMREENPELPVSVPPGPENPLGTHALYFGWPQYLMHGTNKPYGIGRRVSSGCMRMYPEDIKVLFPQVPVGTKVTVVDQPIKVGWIDDALHIEVSPDQDQSLQIEEDQTKVQPYTLTPEDMKRINDKAGKYADKIDWSLVRKLVSEHSGYPIEIMNIEGRAVAQAPKAQAAPVVEDDGEEIVYGDDTPEPVRAQDPTIYGEAQPVKEAQNVARTAPTSNASVNTMQKNKMKGNFNINN